MTFAAGYHTPTIAESGYSGFEATTWHGLFASAGTPAPLISRLHAQFAKVALYAKLVKQAGMRADGAVARTRAYVYSARVSTARSHARTF